MFVPSALLLSANLCAFTIAQQIGKFNPEVHPKISWKRCTNQRCTQAPGELTADADARWLHNGNGTAVCFNATTGWDPTYCPDGVSCAKNCAIDGVESYASNGVFTEGNSLTMRLKNPNGFGPPRLYFMANDTNYELFYLLNKEFTFDVDMSKVECGTNAAVYFGEMDGDGGTFRYPNNKAGAKYGTGYCDAQCNKEGKFINGEANIRRGNETANPYGACCNEMDIFEANKNSAVYVPHVCTKPNVYRCQGAECDEICDKGGCDFNTFRMGNREFLGPGKNNTVNTLRKFTVVTQFHTSNDGPDGTLVEIRRLYVQKHRIIQQSSTFLPGMKKYNSINDEYCAARAEIFDETDEQAARGGLKTMSESLARGVVLIFSFYTDSSETRMQWLDGVKFPPTVADGTLGSARGTCPGGNSSSPAYINANFPDSTVTYSNIKLGPIGSTYSGKSWEEEEEEEEEEDHD